MDKTPLLFLLTLICFTILDAGWIVLVVRPIYESTLADILVKPPRLLPGLAFYFIYITGTVWFACLPAINLRSPQHALRNGVMLGAVAYGTYSFTNLTLLKDYTWFIALSDTAWGSVLTASSAYAGVRLAMKIKPDLVNPAAPLAYEAV